MCLAVPGRIVSVIGDDPWTRTAKVSFGGVIKEVNLAYVPDAAVDDYVIVHAGFALSQIDEAEALRMFDELTRLAELAEDAASEESPAAEGADTPTRDGAGTGAPPDGIPR